MEHYQGETIVSPTQPYIKVFDPVVHERLEVERDAAWDRIDPHRHDTPQQRIDRRTQERVERKRRNACHGGAECLGKWMAIGLWGYILIPAVIMVSIWTLPTVIGWLTW